MKFSNLSFVPLLAFVYFSTASCTNQGNQEATTTTTSTDTNTMSPSPPPTVPVTTSTFDTTAQHMMVVRHRVKNYNQWQTFYDGNDSMRQAASLRPYSISRGITDTSTIMVAAIASDLDKAKTFVKSASLKQAMTKSGAVGTPVVNVYTLRSRNSLSAGTELRSMTTFMVKDWDTWRRKFDSTRQVRVDNGLIDRAYGHEADNNKKVVVVVAVTDSARAAAFWKSDTLRKLRQASGNTTQPERFLYRVVKRY